ncbi:unnamed protein product [Rotaria magnacalcarata]|nr:unnamed protein product [Rotaria magnacalcarata]
MEPQPLQKSLGNNSFKYDNFIEQQLIKEKINNIRKYSGNKYDDVDEWLQNIQQDFSSTLVSDEIRLKLIPKSLTNDAKSWFEQNKHRLLSWQTFTVEIQNRFQSSLHTDQKFIRLRERTQQPKETGQQFIDVMEKLCFQVNPNMMEQEKMLHIKADQLESPSYSSTIDQPLEVDSHCYASSSYYNNYNQHRRRNNYPYRYQPQQARNRQNYRSNQFYESRNRYDQYSNQRQPSQEASTMPYSTRASTYNNSKKY